MCKKHTKHTSSYISVCCITHRPWITPSCLQKYNLENIPISIQGLNVCRYISVHSNLVPFYFHVQGIQVHIVPETKCCSVANFHSLATMLILFGTFCCDYVALPHVIKNVKNECCERVCLHDCSNS